MKLIKIHSLLSLLLKGSFSHLTGLIKLPARRDDNYFFSSLYLKRNPLKIKKIHPIFFVLKPTINSARRDDKYNNNRRCSFEKKKTYRLCRKSASCCKGTNGASRKIRAVFIIGAIRLRSVVKCALLFSSVVPLSRSRDNDIIIISDNAFVSSRFILNPFVTVNRPECLINCCSLGRSMMKKK